MDIVLVDMVTVVVVLVDMVLMDMVPVDVDQVALMDMLHSSLLASWSLSMRHVTGDGDLDA